MKTLAFIQARMGSSRLPGKVLEPLAGEPALVRITDRVAQTPGLDGVAVLTSTESQDDPIRALCDQRGITVVSGSERDVLDRFRVGVERLGADLVVRVTADCPLIDPRVLGELITLQRETGADHAGVATGALSREAGRRRYPDGLDAEVIPAATLGLAAAEAEDPYEREHVTPFIWRRPERFRLELLEAPFDMGDERWTVDYAEDLAFVRAVFERLSDTPAFGWRDVFGLLRREPELRALNAAARSAVIPVRGADVSQPG